MGFWVEGYNKKLTPYLSKGVWATIFPMTVFWIVPCLQNITPLASKGEDEV